jgi:AbiV family abortive infection protein
VNCPQYDAEMEPIPLRSDRKRALLIRSATPGILLRSMHLHREYIVVKKKLDRYKSRLSPEQIAEGMNAASRNAARLVEDADLLLDRGRNPSAAALAILAIEEAGKVSILRHLAISKDDKELATRWHDYRSHTKKNVAWLLPQLVAEGARRLDNFSPLFSEDADHPFILDQVKQISFYTDCLGEAHWSIPQDVIDEPLARMLVQIARIFAKPSEVAPKEIELWIKHMEPVWMTDLEGMKRALIDFHAEMREHGLARHSVQEMEDFLYGASHGGFRHDPS